MKLSKLAKTAGLIFTVTLTASMAGCDSETLYTPTNYTELVNPMIGTDFTGNTYPGAQVPFGMVQLSPDNGTGGWDRIAGYFYPDSTIAGFSHTHLSGTGAGDLYDISFMPVMLPVRDAGGALGIHSRFDHDSEEARAGYYAVTLSDYDIRVELTATERCGVQRYTFPKGKAAIILNLDKAMNWDATQNSTVEVVDSRTIRGFRFSDGWARDQKLWFQTRFSQPWDSIAIHRKPIVRDGKTIGEGSVAWFYFNTSRKMQITVSTAISATGAEGAAMNLATEMPTDEFNVACMNADRMWDEALERVQVEVTDSSQLTTDVVNFYTALYHSMLAPTIYDDADGLYRGPDGELHKGRPNHVNYGTFSLWDTYRAAHPLYALLMPDRAADMAMSLLNFGRQNGRLPVWNFQGCETDMMIGYHSAPVIADAVIKGMMPEPAARRALDLCVKTATMDDYREIGLYRKYGYVPYDLASSPNDDHTDWSLSKTLEYAYDDYCIARLADHLGDSVTAAEFDRRAQSFRNLFNPKTGFFQPRDSKGNFQPDFNPDAYSPHICESNAWHYLWSVQHDIPALVELMGGPEKFGNRLEQMLTAKVDSASLPIFSTGMIGQYAHGNEPGHHALYLFNRAGRRDLTSHYLNRVMNEFYTNSPDGLCGNEDCGQMSAWYVFTALGFYPVDPISGRYELGIPKFRRATVLMPYASPLIIEAPGLTDKSVVKAVKFNGHKLKDTYITYEDIRNGGKLTFVVEDADL